MRVEGDDRRLEARGTHGVDHGDVSAMHAVEASDRDRARADSSSAGVWTTFT